MVKEFSIIKDGKVINRILCSAEFAEQYAAENGYDFTGDPKAKINAVLNNGKYVDPAPAATSAKSNSDALINLLVERNIITAEDAETIKSGQ